MWCRINNGIEVSKYVLLKKNKSKCQNACINSSMRTIKQDGDAGSILDDDISTSSLPEMGIIQYSNQHYKR